jgi:hypothetical protein
MNPQDPTIQPLNTQAAPPPINPPLAPQAPAPAHVEHSLSDPLGFSAPAAAPAAPAPAHPAPEHAAAHLPQPHAAHHGSGHAPEASSPDHLPHIAPVTAGNRPILVTLSIAALFVSLIGSFILYFSNVSTKALTVKAEGSIKDLNAQLATAPLATIDQKLTIINNALAGYKAASGDKVKYDKFFENLPKQTPKDMQISSVTIDGEGMVHITGTGTSFDTAGKSLISFADPNAFLTNVKLENIGLSGTEGAKVVTFEISAQLDKGKLTDTPATPSPNPSGDASTATE